METRETFAGLALWEKGLWYGLVVVSTAIFVWGVARLALKYRRGRGSFLLDQKGGRLRRVVKTTLDHSLIRRRDSLAGLGHLLVFYGFLVLFIGTSILAFQDNVARPLLDSLSNARGPGRRRPPRRPGRQAPRPHPSRRQAGGGRLRQPLRPLLEAPGRPRRLHQVRQVSRRMPGHELRLSALAPRPRPRPTRGGLALRRRKPVRPRRSDPPGDALVVHAVHGVRGDLSRGHRARPDHQPHAPAARRARGHGPDAAADAGDDLHVGQLLRGAEAQARALDARPRLPGQGHSQAGRRAPLVRRRLRLLRPTQPAGDARPRTRPPRRGRRLRDPLRRGAERGLRRPPHRRRGPLRRARGGERGDDLRLPLRAPLHRGSAQLPHPQERVSRVRRELDGAPPLRAPPGAARERAAPAAQGPRLPGDITRPPPPPPLQRRLP